MTIEEFKLKNIKTLDDFELLTNRVSYKGFYFIPDTISNIVVDLSIISNPKNSVILNSK